jgi:hypothetical protein
MDALDAKEEAKMENEGIFQFLINCWYIYERKTLALIGLQYVNEGGSIMLSICCTQYFLK